MSTATLILSIPVIVILAVLVRAFWVEILIAVLAIRLAFAITLLSFFSALVWAIGVENNKEGFWNWWIFFALAYTAVATVMYFIATDIISIGIDFIRKLFK